MHQAALSCAKVREIDRQAIEEYGIPSVVLMENAGRGCTDVLCQLGIRGPVVICCGKGNNAGDGLVIARHLDLRGFQVHILFWSDPAELTGDAQLNYSIVRQAGLNIETSPDAASPQWLADRLADADWIIDALLGTGARGEPRAPYDVVIDQLNGHSARKLAVDIPSGLDCDSGTAASHTFRADHTCTFVVAKAGLVADGADVWAGQLHVLDIGAPRKLLAEFGIASQPPAS